MYIDSHTHIDMITEDGSMGLDEILEGLRENNVERAVQVSIDDSGWQKALNLHREHPGTFLFTAGIHPSTPTSPEKRERLAEFCRMAVSANREGFFGIGECGLDFYRMRQPEEDQRESFHFQVELARELDLPVIVHSRAAMDDTLEVLRASGYERGVFHCFPGNAEDARRALDLGFHISFAGNVTFKKATELQEAARYVPTNRILLETDAPFLTPVPYRGKPNRPFYVIHTYRFMAELKKMNVENLAEQIRQNIDDFMRGTGKKR
jgi:TatD DNase family protein